MDLVIGTATFGTDYGIANRGRVQIESEALRILSEAQNFGISSIDTSPEYSIAEEIIGKFHSTHEKFNCYSKISLNKLNSSTETLNSLTNSLRMMKIKSLKGLYFHNSAELLARPAAQIEALIDAIQDTEKVEKVGASVYELSEILAVHERHPRISLFQVPENIADQRLRYSSEVESLSKSGIEFHVRSIFLQGLLLMENPPAHLSSAQSFLDKLRATANTRSCSPLELCVSYVKQLGWASKFIVGISESIQLRQILEAQECFDENIVIDETIPNDILDPRRWIND